MLRQSKSTSNLKENSNVTKQGAFYELNLGTIFLMFRQEQWSIFVKRYHVQQS